MWLQAELASLQLCWQAGRSDLRTRHTSVMMRVAVPLTRGSGERPARRAPQFDTVTSNPACSKCSILRQERF